MTELVNIRKNPVSLLCFLIAVSVFAVATLTTPENVRFLSFNYDMLPGRWYSFLTYGFVHVDWNHIIINMGLLVWIGVWVERLIGSKRFTALILSGILAGGLTLFLRETEGIGFSAAVAAILFYYHFAFPFKKELLFNIPNIALPVALFIFSVVSIIFGWLPMIGHYPHLAGALVGIALLMLFRKHHNPIEED